MWWASDSRHWWKGSRQAFLTSQYFIFWEVVFKCIFSIPIPGEIVQFEMGWNHHLVLRWGVCIMMNLKCYEMQVVLTWMGKSNQTPYNLCCQCTALKAYLDLPFWVPYMVPLQTCQSTIPVRFIIGMFYFLQSVFQWMYKTYLPKSIYSMMNVETKLFYLPQ